MATETELKGFEWKITNDDGTVIYAYKFPGEAAVIYDADAAIRTLMEVMTRLLKRGVEGYVVS